MPVYRTTPYANHAVRVETLAVRVIAFFVFFFNPTDGKK